MLNFPKDYPDSKIILLDTNYRSNIHIINCSSQLISHNNTRYQKKIKANIGQGSEVSIGHFETMKEQNIRLAEEIIRLNEKGIPLSEMAILVRTNLGAGAIIHKLMEYNIPFIAGDNLPNIYDHWITQDLLSYMKIAMGETIVGIF